MSIITNKGVSEQVIREYRKAKLKIKQCFNPIYLYTRGIYVPCNKCIICNENKRKDWITRLILEAEYWTDVSFLTLTYNNKNLPNKNLPNKPDIQLFFKRLRKKLKIKIKYFLSAGCGKNRGRIHYHGIIFGLHHKNEKLVRKVWKKGRIVDLSSVKIGDYKYCLKNMMEEFEIHQKKFLLVSKGIGKSYTEDKEKIEWHLSHNRRHVVLPRGIKWRLPSYMDTRIFQ